jgi:hypothetical protein
MIMFEKIKKFFRHLGQRGPSIEEFPVAAPVPVPMELPTHHIPAELRPAEVTQREEAQHVIPTHAQSRREARLKRLLAIKNPPAFVLSEIEELKRVD